MRTLARSLSMAVLLLSLAAQAGDRPPAFPVRSVALPTGATLQFAEQGNRAGPVLLCLHGYTDSWKSYARAMPEISRRYRILSVTLRGFGDASKPETGYAGADFTADLVALMDALHISKATVIGHSMGSFIAQQLAFTHPERVEALVLIGSAPKPDNEGVKSLRASVQGFTDPVDPQFVREFQASTVSRPLPSDFFQTVVAESLKVPARVWIAAINGVLAEDHSAELGKIRAPTLVMWGEKDSVFSEAEQRALVAAIPGARRVTFPETGHAPHWEWPERFASELESFLKSVKKAR